LRFVAILLWRCCLFGMLVGSASVTGLAQDRPSSAFGAFQALAQNVGEVCGRIAKQANDIKVYDYCAVEMLRPYIKGSACHSFIKSIDDPGYRCDTQGLLYYKPVDAAAARVMTKQEMGDAFSEVLGRHTRRSIANCLLAGQSNDEAAACLAREKVRVGTVFRICADTKFQAENAALIRAVDQCIETRLKR
jgi:hypothetical protein